jgi:hypothetical protein
MLQHADSLHAELNKLQARLDEINQEREHLEKEIEILQNKLFEAITSVTTPTPLTVSSTEEKIKLFRSLFRGREDVYPVRWEAKTGEKCGYSPACSNEWKRPLCIKPRIKCSVCENRELVPVTDEVIQAHITGKHTIGVYPLLPDETCCFLAADFDKVTWKEDAAAFQNPEFYKAQAMRLSTYGKERIISCAEDFDKHIGLPRGCLGEALELLKVHGIRADIGV